MGLGEVGVRIGVALLLGAAIGFERQWFHRLAGLRTNTLVATGSAAFVTLSTLATGDTATTRIAAQVVSGIGFLGAGVIFKEGLSVRGLNTAATLWCAAAVGSLAGSGFVLAATIAAGLVVVANIAMRPLGHFVDRLPAKGELEVTYRVNVACADTAEPEIRGMLAKSAVAGALQVRALHSERIADAKTARLDATLLGHGRRDAAVEEIARRLSAHPASTSVSWELLAEVHME